MVQSNSYTLNNGHTDGISSLTFHPRKMNILLSTSWDKSFKVYNVLTNDVICEWSDQAALLTGALHDQEHVCYVGGLTGNLIKYDFTRQIEEKIGSHEKAIKTLKYLPGKQIAITGSWDQTCSIWDVRSGALAQKLPCPERVYTMDITPNENYLVIGHAQRIICVWDLRNMGTSLAVQISKRESNIEHQIRSIACGNDNETFAVCASEGRVSMNWIELEKNNANHYAFRCHRSKEGSSEILYPVNAIAFHPIHGTFMTGGSDGNVQLWDGVQRKKLPVSYSFPNSVADVKFNNEGTIMAVASSYTFESGPKENKKDEIYIHKVDPNSMRPLT